MEKIISKIKEELKPFGNNYGSDGARMIMLTSIRDTLHSTLDADFGGMEFEVSRDPLDSKKTLIHPLNLYSFLLLNQINVPYEELEGLDTWTHDGMTYHFNPEEMLGRGWPEYAEHVIDG